MWVSEWTPATSDITPTSKIRIYDAGEYVGFLYGDTWRCWRIQSRVKEGDIIKEELATLLQEWVPFRVYS